MWSYRRPNRGIRTTSGEHAVRKLPKHLSLRCASASEPVLVAGIAGAQKHVDLSTRESGHDRFPNRGVLGVAFKHRVEHGKRVFRRKFTDRQHRLHPDTRVGVEREGRERPRGGRR